MGKVYEALRRANNTVTASQPDKGSNVRSIDDERRKTSANVLAGVELDNLTARNGLERPLFLAPVQPAGRESASTAHTEGHIGSALPGVTAPRSVGATLDAAGSTRAPLDVVTYDISTARVEPHLVAVTQPRSGYCEHFRSLRTRVLHAAEKKKLQTFVITSSGVGEGKTLTTLNLAWMLAQTDGVRALLIDSDLRRPCATDYLGIDDRHGLSEVLAGDASLNDSIVKLNPAGLYLLPGGAPRDDVAELLSGPRFGRVLSEVRNMFDYILIDAPPLGIFTDATVLINRADAALIVVRAGKTRYSVVDRVLDQLPRERLLGVVLNRSHEDVGESDYYYNRERRYKQFDDAESESSELL